MSGCLTTSTRYFSGPPDGIPAGDDWQARLYERLRWADAVVCVVTPAYLESVWCAAGSARPGHWAVNCCRCGPSRAVPRPVDVKQYVDAARDASDARERLRSRLSVIDGGGGWGWPDDSRPIPVCARSTAVSTGCFSAGPTRSPRSPNGCARRSGVHRPSSPWWAPPGAESPR